MEKSVFTPEHEVLLELLRQTRRRAGITQVALAEKVGTTQSIVSKWERGELRLDLVQLRALCQAMGTTLAAFSAEFDRRADELGGKPSKPPRKAK